MEGEGTTHVIYARYKGTGGVWHAVELPGSSSKMHRHSVLAAYKALCGHRFGGTNPLGPLDYTIARGKPKLGRFCATCVRKEAQRPPTDPPAAPSLATV